MTSVRGRVLVLAAAGLAALGAVGCGDDDDQQAAAGTRDAGELTAVSLGLSPQANTAVLKLGVDKGIWKANGIDLKLEVTSNPTSIVPSLVSGQLDAGAFGWGSMSVAAAQGVPIVAVGPIDRGPGSDEQDPTQIVVPESSPIKTPKDLEGKTVAVNSVGGLAELQVRRAVEAAGGDAEKVEPIALPFPNQAAAMRSGRVDAASIADPFLSELEEDTAIRSIASSNLAVMPEIPLFNIIMSKSFVEADKPLVRKFQRALKAVLEYGAAHEDELRALMGSWTGLPADLAASLSPTHITTTVDMAKIQVLADLHHEYGFLKEKVDMSEVTLPFPLPPQD